MLLYLRKTSQIKLNLKFNMKPLIYFIIALVVIAGGIALFNSDKNAVDSEINDFTACVNAGYPVMESYPRQCKTPDGRNFVEEIGNGLEKADLIKVSTPLLNSEIKSPLTIKGEARGFWFFEASFPVSLLDGNGDVVFQSFIIVPETEFGTLILHKDNPSGLPENDDELRIPVKFPAKADEFTKFVDVYFLNNNLDPEVTCEKVFSVQRGIPDTKGVAREAILALLKGPTQSEIANGYYTSINSGVKLNDITIDSNGVLRADFDEKLSFQVAGACKVLAIQAQIMKTLKQFPTVKEVILSINGETEGILEP